jgi:hypothetical protein
MIFYSFNDGQIDEVDNMILMRRIKKVIEIKEIFSMVFQVSNGTPFLSFSSHLKPKSGQET